MNTHFYAFVRHGCLAVAEREVLAVTRRSITYRERSISPYTFEPLSDWGKPIKTDQHYFHQGDDTAADAIKDFRKSTAAALAYAKDYLARLQAKAEALDDFDSTAADTHLDARIACTYCGKVECQDPQCDERLRTVE